MPVAAPAKNVVIRFDAARVFSRVHFSPNAWRRLPEQIESLPPQVFIIVDAKVARLYGGALRRAFREHGSTCDLLTFPAGEAAKTMTTAGLLADRVLAAPVERDSLVVGLGGGVTCDLAGFVASIVLRGLRLVLVPTTLLAMIDAAIGGKTAVNHARGKNLLGTFYPAEKVLIDPSLLRTLPDREWRNGLAELVKTAVVADAALFADIEQSAAALRAHRVSTVSEFAFRAARIKARIVQEDPFETDRRRILNFGHTIGHALERTSGYRLPHGQAVAAGMVIESRVAAALGVASAQFPVRLIALLTRLDLWKPLPRVDWRRLARFLRVDKKRRDGVLYLSLPRAVGRMARTGGVGGVPVREAELRGLLRDVGCCV
jgi:3-dehydroquinate synthase